MSVIYEPPQDRKPIQTYVLEYDREIIKEAITKELERDGQVDYEESKIDVYDYVIKNDNLEKTVSIIEEIIKQENKLCNCE